jgi:hypothetical protein
LFGVPDRKSDAVDCDTDLIRHFELNWRWPPLEFGFDQFENITHKFWTHRFFCSCGLSGIVFGA